MTFFSSSSTSETTQIYVGTEPVVRTCSSAKTKLVTACALVFAVCAFAAPAPPSMRVTTLVLYRASGPTTAPTVTAGAAGNLTGDYSYKVTFVTAIGETDGASSDTVEFVGQRAELTGIPIGGDGVTARKLYRTRTGEFDHLFLATISDNTTTTYSDNALDAALGVLAPTANLSGGSILVNGTPIFYVSTNENVALITFGYLAGQSNRLGQGLIGGHMAGMMMTNGGGLILGNFAGQNLRVGNGLVLLGDGAGRFLISGDHNTGLGLDALGTLTNGHRNTSVGWDSLFNLRLGSENTSIGRFSGEDLRVGSNNVIVGSFITFIYKTNDSSIGLGHGVIIPTNNVFVIGGTPSYARITDGYFGGGHTNDSPAEFRAHSSSAHGSSVAGGDFTIIPGRSTGTGTPGTFKVKTARGTNETATALNAAEDAWTADEFDREYKGTVQTTDATVTTLMQVTLRSNTVARVYVEVIGMSTGATNSAAYGRIQTYKYNTANAQMIGSNSSIGANEDNTAWDCILDLGSDGKSARVRVTGNGSTTINWRGRMRIMYGALPP